MPQRMDSGQSYCQNWTSSMRRARWYRRWLHLRQLRQTTVPQHLWPWPWCNIYYLQNKMHIISSSSVPLAEWKPLSSRAASCSKLSSFFKGHGGGVVLQDILFVIFTWQKTTTEQQFHDSICAFEGKMALPVE
jgi:hypothetical protein